MAHIAVSLVCLLSVCCPLICAAFMQQFVAYVLSCLGGTAMGSIILGQPIGWLASDRTLLVYLIVFLLSWMSATRGIFRALVNAQPFSAAIGFIDDISWGNSVTLLGVQRALTPMHAASPIRSSFSACMVMGTLAGCGGGILRSDTTHTQRLHGLTGPMLPSLTGIATGRPQWMIDCFSLLACLWLVFACCISMMFGFNRRAWSFSVPPQLSGHHFIARMSAAMALLFYVLTNPHAYLPYEGVKVQQAKWTVMVILMTMNTGAALLSSIFAGKTAPVAAAAAAVAGSDKGETRKQAAAAAVTADAESGDDSEPATPASQSAVQRPNRKNGGKRSKKA